MYRRLRQTVRRSRRPLVAIALLAYLASSFPIPLPAGWVARPATPCGSLICRCDESLKRQRQCCCFGALPQSRSEAPPACPSCQKKAASDGATKSCCRKTAEHSGTKARTWVLNSRPCGGDDKLNPWLNTSASAPPPCPGCAFHPRAVDWLRPFPLSAPSRLAPPLLRPPRLSA